LAEVRVVAARAVGLVAAETVREARVAATAAAREATEAKVAGVGAREMAARKEETGATRVASWVVEKAAVGRAEATVAVGAEGVPEAEEAETVAEATVEAQEVAPGAAAKEGAARVEATVAAMAEVAREAAATVVATGAARAEAARAEAARAGGLVVVG